MSFKKCTLLIQYFGLGIIPINSTNFNLLKVTKIPTYEYILY